MPRTLRVGSVVNAAIDGLRADAALVGLLNPGIAADQRVAKVYTNVPEHTIAPYVHILSGAEQVWGQSMGDDTGAQCDLDVMVYSPHRGTRELDAIANVVTQLVSTSYTWQGVSGFAGYDWPDGDVSTKPIQEFIDGELLFRRTVRIRVFVNGAEPS